jgi:hypothetical protein
MQQMPNRFQPPVPGCTDCYYTVPAGKVVGAMGTTNNEGIKVANPTPAPAAAKPVANTGSKPAAAPTASAALPSTDYNDLVFKSGAGAWPVRSTTPLPLFIGSAAGLSRNASATLALVSTCNLHSVSYTTTAGTPAKISIPLSLWDVSTGTKIVDLPTSWDSWAPVVYPDVKVGKQVPAGHKLQISLTQPAYSALPVNFQFTIEVTAHCLKDAKTSYGKVVAPAPAPSVKCGPGYMAFETISAKDLPITKCIKQ